jgi:hypothetical protein
MKKILFVSVIAITFVGCTSSYIVSSFGEKNSLTYNEFNSRVLEKTFTAELSDGRQIEGKNVQVSGDSVQWVDEHSGSTFGLETDKIKSVVLKNHWLGGLEGFGFGLAGGGTLGYIKGSNASQSFLGMYTPLYVATAYGVLGGVLGGIVGLFIGHTSNYEFITE